MHEKRDKGMTTKEKSLEIASSTYSGKINYAIFEHCALRVKSVQV